MTNKAGMNWIRQDKRRKIYERDDYRCLWCGAKVLPKVDATLDHFLPRDRGGCNLSTNVFTSCFPCNSKRQHMSALEFAYTLASARLCGASLRSLAVFDTLATILEALDNPVEARLQCRS